MVLNEHQQTDIMDAVAILLMCEYIFRLFNYVSS